MTRVLVIGAGVVGLAAATRLRGLGCEVEVIEAAARAGGHLADLPLCVLEPEAQQRLAGLDLEELPLTTVVREVARSIPQPPRDSERWRWIAEHWRGAIGSSRSPAQPGPPPKQSAELGVGAALVGALARDVQIRFGWEVLDAKGSADAVTVHYVAPSGERTIDADSVLFALPPKRAAGGERRMTVFFEAALDEIAAEPVAMHLAPSAASGATDVWTLQIARRTTTRIDLSAEGSRRLWNAADEEVGTTLWDLLPSDLPLTTARPAVHRYVISAPLSEQARADDLRVVRARAADSGLASALAAGTEAAERLTRVKSGARHFC